MAKTIADAEGRPSESRWTWVDSLLAVLVLILLILVAYWIWTIVGFFSFRGSFAIIA